MEYAPQPTDAQLAALADAVAPGGAVLFAHRITGGLGCTMDVLQIREKSGTEFKVVLRRRTTWSQGNTDIAASAEFKVLEHLRQSNIPAPEPVWFDENDVFSEPAMLISFIEGGPLQSPDDPINYAEQFALALVKLHSVPLNAEIERLLTDFNAHETKLMTMEQPPDRVAKHKLGERLWSNQRGEIARTPLADSVFAHSDYWPGNTMWKDQHLVAIVDMEEVGLGDPAIDVATAVVNLRYEEWGELAAKRFIEVYQGETGRSLKTLKYWMLRELRKPMPDIKIWLDSFQEMSSRSDITVDELRAIHSKLILQVLES